MAAITHAIPSVAGDAEDAEVTKVRIVSRHG
jgi:hypothetical protein